MTDQTTGQTPDLTWRDTALGRVPVSTRFDDPYYSLDNGLSETQHVFLGGNDLPARFRDGFHIAELGFGTGLNFLTTLAASGNRAGHLHFTSFEAYPITASEAAASLSAFPSLDAQPLINHWDAIFTGPTQITPQVTLHVMTGDARKTVPQWNGQADAWFLDGFSPAKNPELWEPSLIKSVGKHTAPDGTAATYSAAGHVRASLTAAGFTVTRQPGFGRKRHMTTAVMTHAE
ncbi:tRNA (5-methylaminomethyl-2-thiouridine)(34)-methyltransferase MnmD [Yoonia sp. 208BN28-4]|uniref:tRNA (5-methylaminomethyl-2-thiouridine)(34)-methyltransferase MnmD n=1 Tax=Yoonia sp. 208BN28-4 TaxID=3126505 RepID=UPI0030B1EF20